MTDSVRNVLFTFTTADYKQWTEEHLLQAMKETEIEADSNSETDSFSDWVYDQITDAMEAAGHEFKERNPDLFKGDLY